MRIATRHVLSCTLLLACTACSKPEPPPAEQPPEPQAAAPQATELRDAIRAPMDKAKGVEKTLQDAADRQQAQVDAESGG